MCERVIVQVVRCSCREMREDVMRNGREFHAHNLWAEREVVTHRFFRLLGWRRFRWLERCSP